MAGKASRRLDAVEPYIFADIAAQRARVAARGVEVIDLGRGGPDLAPHLEAMEELAVEAANPVNFGYTSYAGSPSFQDAVADWYERHFDHRPVGTVPLMGSKGGLSRVFLAFCDPGDTVILPDPAFPSYASAAALAGLEVHPLTLRPEADWLPDLAEVPPDVARRARLIFINYPNNPTGAAADRPFLENLIAWAAENDVLVIYDNAYNLLSLDGEPLSILGLPGGEDVSLEFHTLSKAYAMAGLRAAYACGQAQALASLRKIELYHQAGLFGPALAACTVALNEGDEYVRKNLAVFRERRKLVSDKLGRQGWEHTLPGGAAYFFLRLPEGENDREFCRELLDAEGVALTPGSAFGSAGTGWVRLALTRPAAELEEALERVARFRAAR